MDLHGAETFEAELEATLRHLQDVFDVKISSAK